MFWAFALDTLSLNGYLTFLVWKFFPKIGQLLIQKVVLIHVDPLTPTYKWKKKIPSDSHNPLSDVSLAADEKLHDKKRLFMEKKSLNVLLGEIAQQNLLSTLGKFQGWSK